MNPKAPLPIPFGKWLIILIVILGTACKKEAGNIVETAPTLAAQPISLPHSNGYYEYLPEGYRSDSASRYPLLLFFHGAGEAGNGTSEINRLLLRGPLELVKNGTFPRSFNVNGQSHKFIILALQFTMYGIYPDEIEAFISYARQKYRVNESRVYLTGMSMGGAECWNYAGKGFEYAQKIAAMVPVAAHIDENAPDHKIDDSKAHIIAAANLPIWSTHNRGDKTSLVTWAMHARDLVAQSDPAPSIPPRLTVFNADIHEGWTETYSPAFKEEGKNVYEWMLQFTR